MVNIDTNSVASIAVENEWNFGDVKELLMHTIHAYPAKFPAFIAQKAFEYAVAEGVRIQAAADVFCGCGTVALEAKLHNVSFWGCDINPVATLIAKAKSRSYDCAVLEEYFFTIQAEFQSKIYEEAIYMNANHRLQYWYTQSSYLDLFKLKSIIIAMDLEEKYQDALLCVFSSTLKATSKWLTKSIIPQVDPNKQEVDVWSAFSTQYRKFLKAAEQINMRELNDVNISIENSNFISDINLPHVDMIISSPPYVTSYEYADLHQLSTLWLDYADDYKALRSGSIGSAYNSEGYEVDFSSLNLVGQAIVRELISENEGKVSAKVRAVARYYCDMQRTVNKCFQMINDGGMVFFVVGDTEYKGIKIRNSEHLIQSLCNEGFSDIKAAKRRISNKLCIPYRDSNGRFSSDKSKRTVYHEEFIISARRWN